MTALERQPETKAMPFAVRPLAEGDIAQSAEIEREAFPRFHIGESLLPQSCEVFDKLGVRNSSEAVAEALKRHLI